MSACGGRYPLARDVRRSDKRSRKVLKPSACPSRVPAPAQALPQAAQFLIVEFLPHVARSTVASDEIFRLLAQAAGRADILQARICDYKLELSYPEASSRVSEASRLRRAPVPSLLSMRDSIVTSRSHRATHTDSDSPPSLCSRRKLPSTPLLLQLIADADLRFPDVPGHCIGRHEQGSDSPPLFGKNSPRTLPITLPL